MLIITCRRQESAALRTGAAQAGGGRHGRWMMDGREDSGPEGGGESPCYVSTAHFLKRRFFNIGGCVQFFIWISHACGICIFFADAGKDAD